MFEKWEAMSSWPTTLSMVLLTTGLFLHKFLTSLNIHLSLFTRDSKSLSLVTMSVHRFNLRTANLYWFFLLFIIVNRSPIRCFPAGILRLCQNLDSSEKGLINAFHPGIPPQRLCKDGRVFGKYSFPANSILSKTDSENSSSLSLWSFVVHLGSQHSCSYFNFNSFSSNYLMMK